MSHPVTQKATLSRVVTVIDASTFGTDWFSWNAAGERKGWIVPGDECAATRKVAELLAEQVEAADSLIINKIDLAGETQSKVATEVAQAINKNKAKVYMASWGKVPLEGLLGSVATKEQIEVESKSHSSHSHSHDHSNETSCKEPACTDESHSHSSDHADHDCSEPACTDASHSHSHDHACADVECDDHSHSHDHTHAPSNDLGISSFVYKASRPFNSGRLMSLLNRWPVPLKEELDLELIQEAATVGYEVADEGMDDQSPFLGVLRSKGFCWLAPTSWSIDSWRHDTAMYWSHAGKHFGIQTAGKWWGSMTEEQMERFGSINPTEFERIKREDFVSEEWKDRRQEIVFIGVALDEDEVTKTLNDCLLNDEELERYRAEQQNFMNTLFSTEAKSASGASLLNVGSTDHMG